MQKRQPRDGSGLPLLFPCVLMCLTPYTLPCIFAGSWGGTGVTSGAPTFGMS